MGIFSLFKGEEKPVYNAAYWKRRREENLATKDIVTRYVACFGSSHYGTFCGIKEIKGFYSKTFEEDTQRTQNWEMTRPIFYQTDFDDSNTYYGYPVQNVFERENAAQNYYNSQCYNHIRPLQAKIDALAAGVK